MQTACSPAERRAVAELDLKRRILGSVEPRRPGGDSQPRWVADLPHSMSLFLRHNGIGMAATIAFFGFLSVVPMVLLLLAFVGNVLAGAISDADVRRLFHGVMPGLSQHQFLKTYWYPVRQSHTATTILGVVSLILGTLGLHDAVDWAVNRIWEAPLKRSFWAAKARGLGVMVWVTVFAVLSL